MKSKIRQPASILLFKRLFHPPAGERLSMQRLSQAVSLRTSVAGEAISKLISKIHAKRLLGPLRGDSQWQGEKWIRILEEGFNGKSLRTNPHKSQWNHVYKHTLKDHHNSLWCNC